MAKRFLRLGIRQPEIPPKQVSTVSSRTKAQTKFQTLNQSQVAVGYQGASKDQGSQLRARQEALVAWGAKVIFAQPSPTEAFCLVMRQTDVIHGWGGTSYHMVYFLDVADFPGIAAGQRFAVKVRGTLEWPI